MLTYDMTQHGDYSLYEYLYLCVRADIEAGVIAPNQKLPSKRALAQNLGVSLVTVEGAYTQLVAEGYVRSEPRRGFYAADLVPGGAADGGAARLLRSAAGGRVLGRGTASLFGESELQTAISGSARSREAAPGFTGDSRVGGMLSGFGGGAEPEGDFAPTLIADLTGSAAATGVFPYAQWAKNMRSVLSQETEESLVGQLDSRGSLRLRRAIARYLQGARGMAVSPSQIVVGAGAQTLYGMIVQLLGRSLRYAVEDPGYGRLSRIYGANDVELVHLPMDGDGVRMDALRKADPNVVHLMPSHQFPTGRVYPVSRRYELLAWAAEDPVRFIVEDDFDCEFRLAGRPIPSLASVDTMGRVIYANTFTKSLGPAFRIGYMVLPPELNQAFDEYLGFYSCTVGALDQLTLAHFIESGEYERHVSRLRSHYRKVQDALVGALRGGSLGPRVSFEGLDAGLHFVLRLQDPRGEDELVSLARERGVAMRGLGDFFFGSAAAGGDGRAFLVSFSGLHADAVEPAVRALEEAWG
ncbi:MAG: PLP-dependent aminotransferase family protein [Coriobacteriia bacterium]|nr:PLP-dependent aminotransferase family protein [Coriobacteriia bacterium]